MAKFYVKMTYSTTRRNDQYAVMVDAADAAAAETAAAAAIATRAPHLATWSMTSQAGLKVVTAVS